MPEEKDQNVQEVVPPTDGEKADNTQPSTDSVSTESSADSSDKNWKEVRGIINQQKLKIAELEEKINGKKPKEEELDDPLAGLSEDDIITVGDTKKVVNKLARKVAKEIIEENSRKMAIEKVPHQHADFNEVIKLVDDYVKENPAAEQAILASPNPRLTAYQLVKSSTIYQQRIGNVEDKKKNAEKVMANMNKPSSSQSIGTTSPLNEVGRYERMTKDRAAEVRRLAEEYAQRR